MFRVPNELLAHVPYTNNNTSWEQSIGWSCIIVIAGYDILLIGMGGGAQRAGGEDSKTAAVQRRFALEVIGAIDIA